MTVNPFLTLLARPSPSSAPDGNDPADRGAVSEDSVALAFTAAHKETLRFDHDRACWYRWEATRWRRDDTQCALDFARNIAREMAAGLSPRERQRIGRAAFCAGVERLARSDPAHAVTQAFWDADPWCLGVPGGVVDLRTGRMGPADPGQGITRSTAVAPGETADCPLWRHFLREATGQDEATVRFLQQWFGYSLTGDTREHALLFIHGPGGNGKSVFMNTLAGILGDYAVTADMGTFAEAKGERHPTDLAMLAGARLVTASETDEGRAWAESRIKALTGGEPVTARFMRQDFFTFRPQFKLTMAGNHQPVLSTVDEAARRRFNILPFTHIPAKPDRTLENRLRAEWPGILRWAIEGCLDWQENGLIRPQAVTEATGTYLDAQDVIARWLEDEVEVDPKNPHLFAASDALHAAYSRYALAIGERPRHLRDLAARFRQLGLADEKRRFAGGEKRGWRGLRLRVGQVGCDGGQG
jgi:putative DNA primase/helicase